MTGMRNVYKITQKVCFAGKVSQLGHLTKICLARRSGFSVCGGAREPLLVLFALPPATSRRASSPG